MLIEKYTSNWIKDFADLKHKIENVLHGLEYGIEHIGSTSIPNLDSKPIIDIDIIYSNQADFEQIKSALEKIGYYHNGNQGNELPRGRASRYRVTQKTTVTDFC